MGFLLAQFCNFYVKMEQSSASWPISGSAPAMIGHKNQWRVASSCGGTLGRPQGGGQEGHLPPGIWKMTSYAAVPQNILKLSLASSALAIDTLYLSLNRREKRKSFRLRCRRAEKSSIFLYGAPKTCQLLKCWSFKMIHTHLFSGTIEWLNLLETASNPLPCWFR